MSEWWTYSPPDFLMFSARTYYRLFELENLRLWPYQFLPLLIAVAVMLMMRRALSLSRRVCVASLGCAWFVCAIQYFHLSYATIHTFADWFALLFGAQAVGLLYYSMSGSICITEILHPLFKRVGLAWIVIMIVFHPLAGLVLGRPISETEFVAFMPDPTVAVTTGVLLIVPSAPAWLWPIPLLWSIYSGITLWTLHSPDAFATPLLVSIAFVLWLFSKRRRARTTSVQKFGSLS